MSWVRLRQVALVAHDLERVVGDLHRAFGLEVAYHDPAVAVFGLHNALLPVGNDFIEIVSPTREGTAGGRQLDRLGGDGGYMVIGHTDHHPALRRRVDALCVRAVIDLEEDGYHYLQLHPSDTGGSFLELDFQPGGDDPAGPWKNAGPDWQQHRRTDVVDGISGVEVQTADPDRTAERWAEIMDAEVRDGVLAMDDATVTFVAGPIDTLVGVTMSTTDPSRRGEQHVIGGVSFTLA